MLLTMPLSRYQAAYRGPLQRRRSASRRDGTWLSDRLRGEHVAAGAPHDLQWRLRGGRVRAVWPAGILWVVSWTLVWHTWSDGCQSVQHSHDSVYITVCWKNKKLYVASSFPGKSLLLFIILHHPTVTGLSLATDCTFLGWNSAPCSW